MIDQHVTLGTKQPLLILLWGSVPI